MRIGFYFDQTRCIGCFTCIVACKDWNDVPAGPASWRRVITIEKGTYPDLFVSFLSTACHHCAEPTCMKACPVDAISKRQEDGIVVVDQQICIGRDVCGKCLIACPYDAPQFGVEDNAKMQKCHYCLDRLLEGKKPVCVDSCPMRALDSGPLEELKSKYGDCTEAEGFTYKQKLKPSVILQPKKDKKSRPVQKIEIAPVTLSIGTNKKVVRELA